MSVYKVNGVWRADSENAPEPQEDSIITTSSTTVVASNFNIDQINTTSYATATSINYDYSNYYWRWNGIQWIYEPEWIWQNPYIGYGTITTSTSGFRVLRWKGKTIIYRLINSQIEYAIVSNKGQVNFIYTDSLETVLKALE